ncbi:hypothetical protein CMEL01_05991 [Colletotrichum melonis]|uniref:Uncharacterized protein n=1 Tax=Colletotrichum melonis TaxID=1209925 RepID=A0AAI9XIJ8_9PEZI|nr:hypothetical protein CMEL01_05991 [Colletotrichum melonis]
MEIGISVYKWAAYLEPEAEPFRFSQPIRFHGWSPETQANRHFVKRNIIPALLICSDLGFRGST